MPAFKLGDEKLRAVAGYMLEMVSAAVVPEEG